MARQMDHSFGMLQGLADADNIAKMASMANKYLGVAGLFPEVHPFVAATGDFLGLRNPGNSLERVAREAVRDRRRSAKIAKEDGCPECFVDKLIRLHDAGKVDSDTMIDAIAGNLLAGSDTTGITLSAAMYYLFHQSRSSLDRLRGELDEAAAQGRISDPITYQEAQQMPYLQAVIKETLRKNPVVGYILPRVTPKDGALLAGRHFPGDVNFSASHVLSPPG